MSGREGGVGVMMITRALNPCRVIEVERKKPMRMRMQTCWRRRRQRRRNEVMMRFTNQVGWAWATRSGKRGREGG